MGYNRIFLEAGVNLNNKFLINNLIDDFYLFISGSSIGKNGSKSFKNTSKIFFKNKIFCDQKINLFGDKLKLYRLK